MSATKSRAAQIFHGWLRMGTSPGETWLTTAEGCKGEHEGKSTEVKTRDQWKLSWHPGVP